MNSPMNEVSVVDRLREVYEKTDSREYAEALDVLELARTAEPGNIYIAALRRQLDALLSLSQADDLSEDQRHELMEPMPGIIECAIRDHDRLSRPGIMESSSTGDQNAVPEEPPATGENEPVHEHETDPGEIQKELEALKLLYFQRASKFVMQGEYEQALAEVRRVFVVDPENTIAKEYASRVEHLIQHARRLASEPLSYTGGTQEGPQTIQADPAPPAEEIPHAHTERSTAWDEEFVAPRPTGSIPEHRPTPPSSRQTVAYGDSLALSLSAARSGVRDDDVEKPGRKKSKLFPVLAIVIVTPLLAGVAVAIFSSKSAGTAGQRDMNSRQAQVQNLNPGPSVEATIGAGQSRTAAVPPTAVQEHQQASPVLPARPAPSPVEQKIDPAPAKTTVPLKSAPVEIAASEPARVSSPVTESVPPPQPKSPVVEQPVPSTPAFVPVQKEPQIVRLEKPEFSSFVWKMGGEGQVVVRVLIDANGKPLDSQILKSTNTVFEQPVIDAVMKSQFNPAQMGQGPVAAWLTIPFKFRQPK